MTCTVGPQVWPATVKPMRSGERGFGYVFLLVLIGVIGAVSAHTLEIGQSTSRRLAEQELLAVGRAFEEALYSYAGVPPAMFTAQQPISVMPSTGPATLEDLLKDPRLPGTRRHLRKIYPDPVTGQAEWGLIRNRAGRIVGIYSLSDQTPIKTTGFGPRHTHFEEAQSYRDWRFGLPVAEVIKGN